jgi:gluconolactonase
MRPLLCLLFLLAACAGSVRPAALPPDCARAEVEVLAEGLGFTEGPVWLPEEECLLFSDIPAARLLRWREGEGLVGSTASPNPNGNLLDGEGRLLTCRHGARDVVRQERDGSLTVLATEFEGRRLNSPNDIACGPDGVLWFTDPPWGLPGQTEGRELPFNGVYRLDPADGAVDLLLEGLCMPNGVALSPDGATLYVADTGGHPSHPVETLREGPAKVRAYRVTDAGLDPEPLWETESLCDGMCVTPEGWIWTTAREGLVLLGPDGAIMGTVPLPEAPTNVCLGRTPGELFVTARSRLLRVLVP